MSRELSTKDMQGISLEVLKIISDICEQNGFRYFLIYGTLIGAIRHQGFIPWDDDIDIMMPRPDYDGFLAYFESHKDDYPDLKLFNPKTCKDYPYMISRVSNQKYEIIMDNEKKYGMGVFVDIYPFDGAGNTFPEAIKFANRGDRLSSLCFQSTREHFTTLGTTSGLKKIIKLPAFVLAKVIGKEYFQTKLAKLANVKEYDRSEYVCCVVWMSNGARELFKRELFDDFEYKKFDKYKFRVPKRFDEILKQNYGNYMELPPEKDRVGHHFYKAYFKNDGNGLR